VLTAELSATRLAELACLLFASFTVWASTAQAGYYCANDPGIEAVDLSEPVDQGFLDTMRGIGIKTIIRYYDHEDETLPGKTLRREERNLILANGFATAVVFQHHNNEFASFTALPSPARIRNREAVPSISGWMAHGKQRTSWQMSPPISEN